MSKISEILTSDQKPALLIGNGINLYRNDGSSSWAQLLRALATPLGLDLSQAEMDEMSNTEFFDILDLAQPRNSRSGLQRAFCELMASWEPSEYHATIVRWAKHHNTPIVTVNFDENLSKSINADFHRGEKFTDWYPWTSYFSDRKIDDPRSSFAVWHAHGMMRYARSIRLGLTHYMGAVQRARPWIHGGKSSLRSLGEQNSDQNWPGRDSWLDVLFFCPLMIFGFAFRKDESFLRWLFLERARLHKINPTWATPAWFIDKPEGVPHSRMRFFEGLGINYVPISDHHEIYDTPTWRT